MSEQTTNVPSDSQTKAEQDSRPGIDVSRDKSVDTTGKEKANKLRSGISLSKAWRGLLKLTVFLLFVCIPGVFISIVLFNKLYDNMQQLDSLERHRQYFIVLGVIVIIALYTIIYKIIPLLWEKLSKPYRTSPYQIKPEDEDPVFGKLEGDEKISHVILNGLKDFLHGNIYLLHVIGIVAFLITSVLVLLILRFLWTAPGIAVSAIQNNKETANQVLIFYIFRGSAIGVITTTVIYFGAKTAIAAFDQATRFIKRTMSTMFLEFL
jgi:hypothetical protein